LTKQGQFDYDPREGKEAHMAKEARMAKEPRKQVGLNMRTALYKDLSKVAKDNGHTMTYVLERAAEHYIQFVAPAESVVRPEIMARVRQSMTKHRKLYQLLAEEKPAVEKPAVAAAQ
jgi:hypothetical protein